jgi:hypothetical protein
MATVATPCMPMDTWTRFDGWDRAMNKVRWISLVLAILGGAFGVAWATGYLGGPEADPQVTAIEEKMTQLRGQDNTLSREQRDAARGEIRQQVESLSPEQREQLFSARREQFEQQMDQRLNEFFALPKEERKTALDKMIDEMEQRRREWQQRGGPGNQQGQAGDRPNRGPGDRPPGDRPTGDGASGRRGARTDAERTERMKQRLDSTSAETRAKRSEFRRLLNERRKERGLPEMRGPGGRR